MTRVRKLSGIRKLVAIAATAVLAGGSLVMASPPAAAGNLAETLTVLHGGPVLVTSTTGKHLRLEVSVLRFANHPGSSNADSKSHLTVTLSSKNGRESHSWLFVLAAHSFTNDPVANGELKTGHQIAPFGRMHLTTRATNGGRNRSCDADNSESIRDVMFTGPLTFLTHSPGPNSWGSLPQHSFSFPHSTLTSGFGPDVEEACTHLPPCVAGISWTASHHNVSLSGANVARKGKKPASSITSTRFVRISTPKHANRLDLVTAKAPPPVFSANGGQPTLTVTSAGGLATGAAKLTSTEHSPFAQDCRSGQEKGRLWNAHYTTRKPRLTVHSQIFGPMTIKADKLASFQRIRITT